MRKKKKRKGSENRLSDAKADMIGSSELGVREASRNLAPSPQIKTPGSPLGGTENLKPDLAANTLLKYKELYTYSTDVLLKEHERFLRSDDKASKYSTMFIFLMGAAAFFEKWGFDRIIKREDRLVNLPDEWPVMVVGAMALLLSGVGWFLANHAIMLRLYAHRPLNMELVDFFDNQSLLNIYDSFARQNIAAYQLNREITDKKHRVQLWAHKMMVLVLLCLAGMGVMFCLYSIF